MNTKTDTTVTPYPKTKLNELYSQQMVAILESSEDAIIGTDLDCCISSWNKGAELMYGYTGDEVVGKQISLLASSDYHQEIYSFMERLTRGEHIKNVETIRVRKDGVQLFVLLSITPVKDEFGTIKGGLSIARDISGIKLREEKLRASEHRFHAIFEQASVGVALVDTTTRRFLQVNKRLCEFLGYTLDEALNLTFVDITHPDDIKESLTKMEHLVKGDVTTVNQEKRYIRKDGTIVWGRISVTPLWLEG